MCDNCKCEEVEQIQGNPQLEVSTEELMEILGQSDKQELIYFREPLEFEDEKMTELVNTKEFVDGKAEATYWCGMWNTMLNAGIPEQLAIELILSHQTNKANEVIQTMNVDMNKEMSKNQLIMAEKNQL